MFRPPFTRLAFGRLAFLATGVSVAVGLSVASLSGAVSAQSTAQNAALGAAQGAAQQGEVTRQTRLETFVDTAHASSDATAVSAAMFDGETLLRQATGQVERRGAAADETTRFLSASVGKTVTALIAAQLVNEGVLDLDAPVSPWLSDVPVWREVAQADQITLRHLLNHSAGIPDYLENWRFHTARGGRREQGFQPAELIDYITGTEAQGVPGAHYAYSDTHYIVVGLVLEAATGETYADLVRTRVIEPVGMVDTESLVGRTYDRLAVGYDRGTFGARATGEPGELNANLAWEWAGGGLVTTPADLARFYHALGSEQFAAERALMIAEPNMLNAELRIGYGLGVFVRIYEDEAYRLFHGGDFAGHRSAAIYDSRTGLALAVQGNHKRLEAPDLLLEFNEDLVRALSASDGPSE